LHIILLSPQAKKSVSVEEVLAGTENHSYGLNIQSLSIPQDPFSAAVKGRSHTGTEETVHGNLPGQQGKTQLVDEA